MVLWGTGHDGQLATILIDQEIDFYVAKNWETNPVFMGKPVKDPQCLSSKRHFVVVAASLFEYDIVEVLEGLTFNHHEDFELWEDFIQIEIKEILIDPLDVDENMVQVLQDGFDYIYSMGRSCNAAIVLKEQGLRKCSGPFDWCITESLCYITKNLESRFRDVFVPKNMVHKRNNGFECLYEDQISGFQSVHDVKVRDEDKSQSLKVLSETFRRRVDRFYDHISDSRKVLLIRNLSADDTYEDLFGFSEALESIFGNKCIVLGIADIPILVIDKKRFSLNTDNRKNIQYFCEEELMARDMQTAINKLVLMLKVQNVRAYFQTRVRSIFLEVIKMKRRGRVPLLFGKYATLCSDILCIYGINDYLLYDSNVCDRENIEVDLYYAVIMDNSKRTAKVEEMLEMKNYKAIEDYFSIFA